MTLISINFVKILKMAFFEKNKNKSQSYKLGEEKGTGKIITIKDAQNGLKCNCICSDCKAPFEAIQGTKNEWHFRHHNKDTNCKGGQETALHLLAKEIICRNTEMIVPNNAKIKYTNPIPETIQDEFRPDITAQYGEENLYFEVVVHNPVSPKKANHYISNEIKTIVLDLSRYKFTNELELEKYIIENTGNKVILFWNKATPINWGNIISIIGIIGFIYLIYLFFKSKSK